MTKLLWIINCWSSSACSSFTHSLEAFISSNLSEGVRIIREENRQTCVTQPVLDLVHILFEMIVHILYEPKCARVCMCLPYPHEPSGKNYQ